MTRFGHFAHNPKDFPTEAHLAIIRFSTIHIPGDERSRTNPGHGYPDRDEPTFSYEWYCLEDEPDWIEEIQRLTDDHDESFVALRNGKKVIIKSKVIVTLE
jgi:hypothetical protein